MLITSLILGLLVFINSTVQAQSLSYLSIGAPDVTAFPDVRFMLDAFDEEGLFIDNLSPDTVRVIENGRAIRPAAVTLTKNGVQVILVLNLDPTLANKTEGVTSYQRITEAFAAWANAQPAAGMDDFSLSTPTGLYVIRANEPGRLAEALQEYQPELARAQSSLTSLAEALDLATDPLNRPNMKRAIVYITPPLPPAQMATLPDLAARAQDIGVRVSVWQIGADGTASSGADSPLQQMAEGTGGRFYAVTPAALLPEVEMIFQPLRYHYEIQYTSIVKQSGTSSVSVETELGGVKSTSNEQGFTVTVQPPNPIFLSPPTSILRSWSPGNGDETPKLMPESVDLQILVEFPDQHARKLRATRLFINGQVVDENLSEPFDRFQWAVAENSTSARQVLRVEAEDVLGLKGTSIEVPVEILVEQSAQTQMIRPFSGRSIAAIAAVSASGIVLIVVFVMTNSQRQARWKRLQTDKKRMKDPVTQPVPIRQEKKRLPKENGIFAKASAARASAAWPVWNRSSKEISAASRLVALDDKDQPLTGGVILLSRQEITFGSDPKRATQVLESKTVDGLHARVSKNQDGAFLLTDQNSVAGTWVNYTPVGPEGVLLVHGDILHIGRLSFRYELTNPPSETQPKVTVTQLEEDR